MIFKVFNTRGAQILLEIVPSLMVFEINKTFDFLKIYDGSQNIKFQAEN